MSYLERYIGGEYEQVWGELLALGEQVREASVFEDAQAVAWETMRRVRTNIEMLVPRLTELRYRFGALPENENYWKTSPPFAPPSANVATSITQLESRVGSLPVSLSAFFQVVGSVNLLGFHPAWPDIEVLDPLYVDPLDSGFLKVHLSHYKEWQEYANDAIAEDEEVEPFTLDLSPDDYHKGNISGGPPYGVPVPCSNVDAPFENEWHGTTFVNYLRLCFRWGGFPGFERCEMSPDQDIAFLTQGLLPL